MTYHLRERGLIESRGGGRARKYHLSAQIYRRMEQPDGYVRTHGIDPIQHEAMVLQYVKGHKKIVCNDVMRLCALNSDQATSLLRRMTKKGWLERHGNPPRWVFYVLGMKAPR